MESACIFVYVPGFAMMYRPRSLATWMNWRHPISSSLLLVIHFSRELDAIRQHEVSGAAQGQAEIGGTAAARFSLV